MGHDFLINWDDNDYVMENPVVRGLTLQHIAKAFSANALGNYAPLHLISYMLDYDIWGLRPSGYILTNILLHTANGLLFYFLLRRLYGGNAWVFFASLFFLVHPVQVESVVWVSQRKNVLSLLLFLASFHFYISYKGNQQHTVVAYVLSVAAFGLALLTKSVVVILPVVLVLYDVCFRDERGIRRLLADKVPFLALSLTFGIVAIQSHSAQVQGGISSYHGGSLYTTTLTMLPVLFGYLRLVLWPVDLSAFYDPPVKTGIDLAVALSAVLFTFLVLVGAFLYRKRRRLFFWYALFFIGLLPVSQIVPLVTLMNDRYLYFPMLGAAALAACAIVGGSAWPDVLTSKRLIVASVVCAVLVAVCATLTRERVGVWKNSATLWADAVEKAPNVALTHDAFGEGLMERGRVDDAIRQYEIALSLWPDFTTQNLSTGTRNAMANTYSNLGAAYGQKGWIDGAIQYLSIAIQLNPAFAKAYFNLGNALMHKGLVDQALECFEAAVRLNPGNELFVANLNLTREIVRSQGHRGTR
jgi:hypothetical protein